MKESIDRFLWPCVSSTLGYVALIIALAIGIPFTVAMVLPWSTWATTVFVAVCVVCIVCGGVIHGSRERWLLLRWSRQEKEHRKDLHRRRKHDLPTLRMKDAPAGTRDFVRKLIDQGKPRP